jgi:flavin reductase (DIM6/NTAB) family NADH-FMN oxidoreductase RutF
MTDPDPLVTKLPDLFRLGMRRHASSVCVITTVHDRRRHGITATAIASVCANPPTLRVCINQAASLHGPVKASGRGRSTPPPIYHDGRYSHPSPHEV